MVPVTYPKPCDLIYEYLIAIYVTRSNDFWPENLSGTTKPEVLESLEDARLDRLMTINHYWDIT